MTCYTTDVFIKASPTEMKKIFHNIHLPVDSKILGPFQLLVLLQHPTKHPVLRN